MDNLTYILLGILVLLLIVGGPFLKGWANRKASAAGENAGRKFAANQLVKVLGEFGTTVVIHAPEAVAREIVAEAAAKKPKDFPPRADGGYGIRFTEADDAIVRLVPGSAGVRVQVETFREYMGFPQTAPFWKDLRGRIAAAATARGVTVEEGPRLDYLRGPLLDVKNARWSLDA
ncbi:hypothetical protein [Microbacterium sp. 179-I 3D4 NHS]|uniref:hypothetical protein n=1 Tax=Microbacterium sp. 179-I 3D4 NHS TaxID=3142381 RepID=UPI0039A39365